MDVLLLIKLEKLRVLYGKPMKINSACRCRAHNADVKGKPNSFHITTKKTSCKAVDISATNAQDKFEIVKLALQSGFTGIGINPLFIHLDIREATNGDLFTY